MSDWSIVASVMLLGQLDPLQSLGFEVTSAGDFFRALAKERGFDSLLAFQESLHTEGGDTGVDELVDARTKLYGEMHDEFVIEGRLCAHMIQEAFKILLLCDDTVRYERVASRQNVSVEDAQYETEKREALYTAFYKKHYGIEDYLGSAHYDLVIDTTEKSPSEILKEIITHITQ
jgi:cytidylate kinase